MWNARLGESQTGIKIAGRNINNLRYADDTILMAESDEVLKNLLVKVKEESEKAGLKLNIKKKKKTKIMASGPIVLKVLIARLCSTLCDSMDCCPPDSSIHGILQSRILEWVVIPFSRGSSSPRDQT